MICIYFCLQIVEFFFSVEEKHFTVNDVVNTNSFVSIDILGDISFENFGYSFENVSVLILFHTQNYKICLPHNII